MNILEDRQIKNKMILPIDLDLNENDNPIRVTSNYIDISYQSKQTPSRVLSNLYPYEFNYHGHKVKSIEAAIQSLKYNDEDIRKYCYEYSGIDAVHLRGLTPYKWQEDGILYTPIGPIDRFSEEYQKFLDELYYSAYQNPIYKNNLLNSYPKQLDHTIGENDKRFTTLTRTEYISRLYALRYCAINEIDNKNGVKPTLERVRNELKQ